MILAILIFGCIELFSSNENDQLRTYYHLAAQDKHNLDLLISACAVLNNQNSTAYGYCSMIHFLEAKNSFNPYKKFNEFNIGKTKLDSLISINPNNIELRYMRHSIQERAPGFLGYNENLTADEDFMQANLRLITDSATYQLIYNYLKQPSD